MSHQVSDAPARPSHLFVDSVRFWSMLGIVTLHAIITVVANPSEGFLPAEAECLVKFGTIGFFLISGFLLGDRMETSAPMAYLSRRLRILLGPWAIWFALDFVYLIAADIGSHRLNPHSYVSWLQQMQVELEFALFGSAYWFVPNLALGMCILLLFRKYLHTLGLGILLFAVNFVYVVNIYFEWFTPRHTAALFAFVSFLWLGTYTAKNFSIFSRFMDRIPTSALAAFAVVAYLGSVAEMRFLTARHSIDPVNTLRFSNQIFSVSVVLLLFKLKEPSWPWFINVRQQTYCIYLVHIFFLHIAFAASNRILGPGLMLGAHPSFSFPARIVLFLLAYGGSLIVANSLARSERWRWVIGVHPPKPQTAL